MEKRRNEIENNKCFYADIHGHYLYGVDDGAKTEEMARAMLSAAYLDGTRLFCLTPHFWPGAFGDNREKTNASFQSLLTWAAAELPEAKIHLGNELRYSMGCQEWILNGYCKPLNDTRFVLVDFSEHVDAATILDAMAKTLSTGYRPVLAHVERYRDLQKNYRYLYRLKDWDVVLQVDAASLFGGWDFRAKQCSRRLLHDQVIDLICSDAHDLTSRPPQLSSAFSYICNREGIQYARSLLWDAAFEIINS